MDREGINWDNKEIHGSGKSMRGYILTIPGFKGRTLIFLSAKMTGENFEKLNANGRIDGKVEIGTTKKFLAMGEACVAIF